MVSNIHEVANFSTFCGILFSRFLVSFLGTVQMNTPEENFQQIAIKNYNLDRKMVALIISFSAKFTNLAFHPKLLLILRFKSILGPPIYVL